MPDPQSSAYDVLASAANTGIVPPGAVEGLVSLGPDAIPAIRQALALPDRAPRRAAVLALAAIPVAEAPALLRAFVEAPCADELDLVAPAVDALASHALAGRSAVDAELLARLSLAPWPPIRLAAAGLAPQLPVDQTAAALLRLSRDPEPPVARHALAVLTGLPGVPLDLLWRARLGHADDEVRAAALEALAGDADAAGVVGALLRSGDAYALPAALALAVRLPGARLDDALLPIAADPGLPASLRALALAGLNPDEPSSAELLVRALVGGELESRAAAAGCLARAGSRATLRRLGAALPDADPHVIERVGDAWARAGSRAHGVLVAGATAALERLAHACFGAAECARAAMALHRALLAAHLAGVVLEEATISAVARWTWSQDSRVAALARRVHDALSQPPPAAGDAAGDEAIRQLLARGDDADLVAAIALLSTPERVGAWLDALLDHLPAAGDEVLVHACTVLAMAPSSARGRGVLQRLTLHPSAAVRAAALAAAPPAGP